MNIQDMVYSRGSEQSNLRFKESTESHSQVPGNNNKNIIA